MKIFKILPLVIGILFLTFCNKNSVDPKVEENVHAAISFNIQQVPPDVSTIVALLSKENYDTLELELTIEGNSAQGSFFNIPTGNWNLQVNAYDASGLLLYSGAATVLVNPGQTTVVNLVLQESTGNLEIHVTWGSNFTWQQLEFEGYTDNPVLTGDSSWNYAGVVNPRVIKEDGIYKMWFNGRGSTSFRIGYAFSNDGINWEIYPEPVLVPGDSGAFDDKFIRWTSILREDSQYISQYIMYYTGGNFQQEYGIGVAFSSDGINWEKYSGNPVLSPGSSQDFDGEFIGMPSVLQVNGQYYMWYVGSSSYSNRQIGMAMSDDGLHWEKYSYNPVLTVGYSGDWESYLVSAPFVIKTEEYFEMYYTGYNLTSRQIGRARSLDGIIWEKDPYNPVIPNGASYSWNEFSSSGVCLLPVENGFKVWFAGQSYNDFWSIGYGQLNF